MIITSKPPIGQFLKYAQKQTIFFFTEKNHAGFYLHFLFNLCD